MARDLEVAGGRSHGGSSARIHVGGAPRSGAAPLVAQVLTLAADRADQPVLRMHQDWPQVFQHRCSQYQKLLQQWSLQLALEN